MVSIAAAMGKECGLVNMWGERFQADAFGPVDGTVALGLDDGLLGGPGNDVGGKVIGFDKLLFTGIEELIANPQHLLAVKPFSVKPNDTVIVECHSDQMHRVGDAEVHLLALNKGGSLLIMRQRHRMSKCLTQQQPLGRLFTLPLNRLIEQIITRDTLLLTQCQQLLRVFFQSPNQHPSRTWIFHFLIDHRWDGD